MTTGSTPSFTEFDPSIIPMQDQVVDDIVCNFDYSKSLHELLLSGSVGSAKSILMAHIAVLHCLKYNRARVLLGRRSLPDLKSTIFAKILEHLEGSFKEGIDYVFQETTANIQFRNGSEIISRSWADKRYKKIRSLEISAAIIEELSENSDEDKQAYDEIKMRIGRLPHVPEKWIISATNPDAPSHWIYKYFMEDKSPTKHVYYSITEDNPFLPRSYIEQLKNDLDPKLARRMLYGEWIEITNEVVYHAYDKTKNYSDTTYKVDEKHPVYISWDFNIGEGKPLSLVLFQFINDHMHIFNEVVVHGMRTEDSCDELLAKGLLDFKTNYILTGDASGKHKDTRSRRSDYEIIEKFFANRINKYGETVAFQMKVPLSNPPIRKRHNLVNAYCLSESGKIRITVYREAPTADKGLRLTQLKKGGNYIEDDSKEYQHITTAIGYGLLVAARESTRAPQQTLRL